MKSKYIPIFSAGLIFLGFVLNQGYYYHFGLNITNYFTTGELILSFLDVSLIAVLSVFYIVYFLFFQFKNYEGEIIAKEKRKLAEEKNQNSPENENEVKGRFFKKNLHKFKLWLIKVDKRLNESENFLKKLAQYAFLAFLIGVTYININGYHLKKSGFADNPFNFFLLTFIWILIIIVEFSKSFEKVLKSKVFEGTSDSFPKTTPRWMIFFVSFSFFCISLWAYSSFKAFTILANKPAYYFEIKINGDFYESSENLIFVGQSSDYLFIRELSSEKNIILRTDNVDYFSLKKIQKEKPKNQP